MAERPDLLDGAIAPEENTALCGHEEAEAFLVDCYRAGRLHHALLIEGPEGIGKATLAFRLANFLVSNPDRQTEAQRLPDPDASAPSFRQIASGASHNVLHIRRPMDEKSGKLKGVITVEEIRRLGRFFGQTSGSGNWRIAIIDPADDLNRNAANALLKMLEEPPRNALFLVLSHTPGRLLPTIRSRCMALTLRPLSRGDLGHALSHLDIRFDIETGYGPSEGSVARALMLANYGGVDIAEAFDRIHRAGNAKDRAGIHALATTLAARDREVAYHFFVEHVVARIRQRATELASEGRVAEAAREAERASAVSAHFDRAETYNLDRAQTVITLFSLLFD